MSTEDKIYINGINGATGDYLKSPLEYSELARIIKGEPNPDPKWVDVLETIWKFLKVPHAGLPAGVDPANVQEAGWAVVFHTDEDEAVPQALAPLVEHRRQQIGDTRVKVLKYPTGDDSTKWLARYGVSSSDVDPTKVPFYLLLVGSPERIPFSFVHQMDLNYAVGRLHFDTAKEYADYVASLIDYETSQTLPNSNEAVFFAPRHPLDEATQLSADELVNPLANGSGPGQKGVAERWRFRTRKILGDAATKSALTEVLRPAVGEKPPAFLFTASHGMGFPNGDSRQLQHQGALLCQDWPGRDAKTISQEHYFSGTDVPSDARIHGMIAFLFACYGAGTPSHDRFFKYENSGVLPDRIAPQPFIAALPKALLTHAQGGALACISHVDRAWGCSIKTLMAGRQIQAFENVISRILLGEPVGLAMKDFNERYATASVDLLSKLENDRMGIVRLSDKDLALDWLERNDAEGYMIIGDPAVRLRVSHLE